MSFGFVCRSTETEFKKFVGDKAAPLTRRRRPHLSRLHPRCAATSVQSVSLPKSLENPVAVLSVDREGTSTDCYVLGVSHVSMLSCQQVTELIDVVRPDTVCIELSRDRVGLLVDRDRQDSQTWQARQIGISGATFSDDWPKKEDILKLIKTKKGVPIQLEDIEADVVKLLATGLFSRGRPVFSRADETEAPAFLAKYKDGDLEVQTVPPLGGVEFEMRDRSLPPIIRISLRVDSSLMDYSLDQEYLDRLTQEALEASKEDSLSLGCYLKLRRQALEHCIERGAKDAVTIFRGEEQGKVEVILRDRKPSDPLIVTGFEEGAEGGYGWGIETFRPANRPFKLSEKMLIPTKRLQILTGNEGEANRNPKDAESDASLMKKLTDNTIPWREWTENETPLILEDDNRKGIADYFGAAVTSLYGRFQGDAGRKVGVDPGAAWREALKASVKNIVSQIQLFDIPEQVNQKQIAESIFAGMGARFALTVVYAITVAQLSTRSWSPDLFSDNALSIGFFGSIVLLWPVLAPYVEIAWLASKTAEDIEDAVKVKEPIQADLETPFKLFGEDALLDWPGAMDPVIDRRDKYMARNLFTTAINESNAAPAYIPEVQDRQVVCRLLMPENGPRKAAPMGTGDGVYLPIRKNGVEEDGSYRRIVAVVGTAHVRGICREWERLKATNGVETVDEFLI